MRPKKPTKQKRKYTRKAEAKVSIRLPKDLVETASKLLQDRGTDLTTYLRLTTLAFTRMLKPLGLKDVIDFGQYRDEATVEEVCRINPKYVRWLIAESKSKKFEPEVLELIDELLPEIITERDGVIATLQDRRNEDAMDALRTQISEGMELLERIGH